MQLLWLDFLRMRCLWLWLCSVTTGLEFARGSARAFRAKRTHKDMKNAKLMLQMHRHITATAIEEISRYGTVVEELLERESAEISRDLDARALEIPEDVREEFYEYNSEYYQDVAWHFPNQFRMSLVSAAYTMLEENLIGIAKMLGRVKKSKLTITDFKGDAYSRAKLFLTKVIEIPLTATDWEPLDPYMFVRNFIVHSAGSLDKNHNRYAAVKQHISKHEHISADHLEHIVLTRGYAEAYLRQIAAFYSKLYSACEQWLTIRPVEP